VAEVGVGSPRTSQVRGFVADGTRCTLVEPEPRSVAEIRSAWSRKDNVTLHEVAVLDRDGPVDLLQRGPSTFVADLEVVPAIVNDGYAPVPEDRFAVPAVRFEEIDDGTIDLLAVDVEGSEWFVIRGLTSRPAVISVETHGARYTHARLREISAWMSSNGYRTWYKTKTDTVFVLPASIRVGIVDHLKGCLMNGYLAWRSFRKGSGAGSK